jgi:Transposase DDE domain
MRPQGSDARPASRIYFARGLTSFSSTNCHLTACWPVRTIGHLEKYPWSDPRKSDSVLWRQDLKAGAGDGAEGLFRYEPAANTTRSRIRARVEHVFGHQENSMGRKLVRTIGIARATVKIGMMNLVYNMRRLVQLERMTTVPNRCSGKLAPTQVCERFAIAISMQQQSGQTELTLTSKLRSIKTTGSRVSRYSSRNPWAIPLLPFPRSAGEES